MKFFKSHKEITVKEKLLLLDKCSDSDLYDDSDNTVIQKAYSKLYNKGICI